MTHKTLSKTLNLFAAVLSASGAIIACAAAPLYAAVTGQGSNLMEQFPADETLRAAANMYPEQFATVEAGIQLILGMLLLLLGLFIHAFVRTTDERPVHITAVPSRKKSTWFWMEMRF